MMSLTENEKIWVINFKWTFFLTVVLANYQRILMWLLSAFMAFILNHKEFRLSSMFSFIIFRYVFQYPKNDFSIFIPVNHFLLIKWHNRILSICWQKQILPKSSLKPLKSQFFYFTMNHNEKAFSSFPYVPGFGMKKKPFYMSCNLLPSLCRQISMKYF